MKEKWTERLKHRDAGNPDHVTSAGTAASRIREAEGQALWQSRKGGDIVPTQPTHVHPLPPAAEMAPLGESPQRPKPRRSPSPKVKTVPAPGWSPTKDWSQIQ